MAARDTKGLAEPFSRIPDEQKTAIQTAYERYITDDRIDTENDYWAFYDAVVVELGGVVEEILRRATRQYEIEFGID